MTFATIYHHALSRFVAALIVLLVVSPYTAPFATIDGTDYGGSGAVDVGGASKFKTDSQDALPVPLGVTITPVLLGDVSRRPIIETPLIPHRVRHAILRL
jgi:hypothetical protein